MAESVTRPPFSKKISVPAWAGMVAVVAALTALAALGGGLGEPVAAALAHGFSFVCHQIAERSFTVAGHTMLLCHRCFGVLIGFLGGTALFAAAYRFDDRLWKYSRTLIVISLIPMGLDWGLDAVGVLGNTPVSRLATGAIFGMVAVYFVARGVIPKRKSAAPAGHRPVPSDLNAVTEEF